MPTIYIILIGIVALIIIVLVIILVRSFSGKEGISDRGQPPEQPPEQPPILEQPKKQPRQPIDRVKDLFNQDMEDQGYEDAQSNSDSGFRQQKVLELKEQGRQECISAISEYEDKIADIDANIVKYTNALLMDTVEDFKAQKVKYQKNIERIKQMQTELNNETLKVYNSYCKGFAKWQKAIAEGLINN